jgi:hypothetical protein
MIILLIILATCFCVYKEYDLFLLRQKEEEEEEENALYLFTPENDPRSEFRTTPKDKN